MTTNSMKSNFCLAVFVTHMLCQAASAAPGEWWMNFMVGAVPNGTSDLIITDRTSGAVLAKSNERNRISPSIGWEFEFVGPGILGVALRGEVAKLGYDGGNSDIATTVFLMPRLRLIDLRTIASIWTGGAIGLATISLGNRQMGAANYSFDQYTGIAISPRAGIDFDMSDYVMLGAELGYNITQGGLTVTDLATSSQTTADLKRRWWSLLMTLSFHISPK
jgi:hypothetical protein